MSPYRRKGYSGVIASDEINKLEPKNKMGFIMNTDPRNKAGEHWIAVSIDTKGDQSLEYYDSFADPPSKQFMRDIKGLIEEINPDVYLKFKINKIKNQSVKTSNCGYFAIKFLIDRLNGKSWRFCSGCSDISKSEKQIEKFKHKFDYIV